MQEGEKHPHPGTDSHPTLWVPSHVADLKHKELPSGSSLKGLLNPGMLCALHPEASCTSDNLEHPGQTGRGLICSLKPDTKTQPEHFQNLPVPFLPQTWGPELGDWLLPLGAQQQFPTVSRTVTASLWALRHRGLNCPGVIRSCSDPRLGQLPAHPLHLY
jgi:hypothetical protein